MFTKNFGPMWLKSFFSSQLIPNEKRQIHHQIDQQPEQLNAKIEWIFMQQIGIQLSKFRGRKWN